MTSPRKPDDSSRAASASHDGRSDGAACTLTAMSGTVLKLPVLLSPAQLIHRQANLAARPYPVLDPRGMMVGDV
jgi:hypothetical protein